MFNFRYLLFLVLSITSFASYSAEYVWTIDSGGGQSFYGSTPTESFDKFKAHRDASGYYTAFSEFLPIPEQSRYIAYFYTSTPHTQGNKQSVNIARTGDSCPSDSTFNMETGICDANPTQCEEGQSSSFEFLYCYDYDGTGGCSAGSQTGRPGSFCRNSCVHVPDYNPGTSDADCYSYGNGDGSSGPAVMCSVSAETNGSECSGEYSPESPDNSCPSGTVPGQVNGKNVCVPSGDGGGDGGDNGGGDGGENGGDNGGGDGGENGGGDGDGTGGNGNGNGNGGNGDGTGGSGDGTGGTGTGGDGDGEGDGSGSAEGVDNCESGRCDFGDDRGDPFGGEVRSFSESLTAAMTGMKNSPLGNSIGNIQFPTGGTCPTGSTSINIGIGSIPIEFSEHCNFWQQIAPILSAVFLAFWAILAVRVFLSA